MNAFDVTPALSIDITTTITGGLVLGVAVAVVFLLGLLNLPATLAVEGQSWSCWFLLCEQKPSRLPGKPGARRQIQWHNMSEEENPAQRWRGRQTEPRVRRTAAWPK